MKKLIFASLLGVFAVTSVQAADLTIRRHKRVMVQEQPVQVIAPRPAPLIQIPVVGTIVEGALNFASDIVRSPTELIGAPRR